MMVLAARLSFDSERYFCYDAGEGQSPLGPRGASRRAALSLAQLLTVGLRLIASQVYHCQAALSSLPHKSKGRVK